MHYILCAHGLPTHQSTISSTLLPALGSHSPPVPLFPSPLASSDRQRPKPVDFRERCGVTPRSYEGAEGSQGSGGTKEGDEEGDEGHEGKVSGTGWCCGTDVSAPVDACTVVWASAAERRRLLRFLRS